MTVAQMVPGALDTSWPDQARIVELASRATIDDTQLFWQMAVSGRRDVHLASSARAGLEMILLRMIAFRPAVIIHGDGSAGAPPAKKPEPPAAPVETRLEKASRSGAAAVQSLSDAVSEVVSVEPARKVEATDARGGATPENARPAESKRVACASPTGDIHAGAKRQSEREMEGTLPCEPERGLAPPKMPAGEVGEPEDDDLTTLPPAHGLSNFSQDSWPVLFEELRFGGILHNIALHLELSRCSDKELNFTIAQSDSALLNERHAAQLTQALRQQVDESIVATIIVDRHEGHTPANRRAATAAARLADAEQAIASDDALHTLMRVFDGEIIPGSIRPMAVDIEHSEIDADLEQASEA